MIKLQGLGAEACGAGYHFDTAFGGCVADSVPPPPASSFDPKILIFGLGAILILGAFMGGRAVGKKSSGKLLSRTTTRSIFG